MLSHKVQYEERTRPKANGMRSIYWGKGRGRMGYCSAHKERAPDATLVRREEDFDVVLEEIKESWRSQ